MNFFFLSFFGVAVKSHLASAAVSLGPSYFPSAWPWLLSAFGFSPAIGSWWTVWNGGDFSLSRTFVFFFFIAIIHFLTVCFLSLSLAFQLWEWVCVWRSSLSSDCPASKCRRSCWLASSSTTFSGSFSPRTFSTPTLWSKWPPGRPTIPSVSWPRSSTLLLGWPETPRNFRCPANSSSPACITSATFRCWAWATSSCPACSCASFYATTRTRSRNCSTRPRRECPRQTTSTESRTSIARWLATSSDCWQPPFRPSSSKPPSLRCCTWCHSRYCRSSSWLISRYEITSPKK